MKKHRIAPEVKEQIINRIKNDGVTVATAAKDHGVSEASIYDWLGKNIKGVSSFPEMNKLKQENTEPLRLEGEITLKLSESKKRSDQTQNALEDRTGTLAWCGALHLVLQTE
ncbi:MAG: transposase [Candidatus Thiodiazotropha sp. (ex Troendleina suluensis)]|nr:transposase [Candidatus Thiodiazotropha sp. (ex Troendleina suluensis)]